MAVDVVPVLDPSKFKLRFDDVANKVVQNKPKVDVSPENLRFLLSSLVKLVQNQTSKLEEQAAQIAANEKLIKSHAEEIITLKEIQTKHSADILSNKEGLAAHTINIQMLETVMEAAAADEGDEDVDGVDIESAGVAPRTAGSFAQAAGRLSAEEKEGRLGLSKNYDIMRLEDEVRTSGVPSPSKPAEVPRINPSDISADVAADVDSEEPTATAERTRTPAEETEVATKTTVEENTMPRTSSAQEELAPTHVEMMEAASPQPRVSQLAAGFTRKNNTVVLRRKISHLEEKMRSADNSIYNLRKKQDVFTKLIAKLTARVSGHSPQAAVSTVTEGTGESMVASEPLHAEGCVADVDSDFVLMGEKRASVTPCQQDAASIGDVPSKPGEEEPPAAAATGDRDYTDDGVVADNPLMGTEDSSDADLLPAEDTALDSPQIEGGISLPISSPSGETTIEEERVAPLSTISEESPGMTPEIALAENLGKLTEDTFEADKKAVLNEIRQYLDQMKFKENYYLGQFRQITEKLSTLGRRVEEEADLRLRVEGDMDQCGKRMSYCIEQVVSLARRVNALKDDVERETRQRNYEEDALRRGPGSVLGWFARDPTHSPTDGHPHPPSNPPTLSSTGDREGDVGPDGTLRIGRGGGLHDRLGVEKGRERSKSERSSVRSPHHDLGGRRSSNSLTRSRARGRTDASSDGSASPVSESDQPTESFKRRIRYVPSKSPRPTQLEVEENEKLRRISNMQALEDVSALLVRLDKVEKKVVLLSEICDARVLADMRKDIRQLHDRAELNEIDVEKTRQALATVDTLSESVRENVDEIRSLDQRVATILQHEETKQLHQQINEVHSLFKSLEDAMSSKVDSKTLESIRRALAEKVGKQPLDKLREDITLARLSLDELKQQTLTLQDVDGKIQEEVGQVSDVAHAAAQRAALSKKELSEKIDSVLDTVNDIQPQLEDNTGTIAQLLRRLSEIKTGGEAVIVQDAMKKAEKPKIRFMQLICSRLDSKRVDDYRSLNKALKRVDRELGRKADSAEVEKLRHVFESCALLLNGDGKPQYGEVHQRCRACNTLLFMCTRCGKDEPAFSSNYPSPTPATHLASQAQTPCQSQAPSHKSRSRRVLSVAVSGGTEVSLCGSQSARGAGSKPAASKGSGSKSARNWTHEPLPPLRPA